MTRGRLLSAGNGKTLLLAVASFAVLGALVAATIAILSPDASAAKKKSSADADAAVEIKPGADATTGASPAPAAAAAAAAAAAPSAPQAPKVIKTESMNFDLWTVQCSTYSDAAIGRVCQARLPVYRANSKQLLVILVADRDGGNERLVMHFPTSVAIQPGVSFVAGESLKFKAPIASCEPAMCTALVLLQKDSVAALANSGSATLEFTSLSAGLTKVDFPLKGVQSALAQIAPAP